MLRTQKRRLRKQTLKSLSSYQASVNAATRGLFNKVFDIFDFVDAMYSAIERGYEQAWQEGANVCGIKPDERTPAEMSQLASFISIAKSSVFDFGERIEDAETLPSTAIWVNRYNEVKSKAQAMSCSDTKGRWILGSTKEHCKTCNGLAGRVYRMSVWDRNVLPQSRRLACGGWRCRCRIEPTNDKITPGKFPGSLLG